MLLGLVGAGLMITGSAVTYILLPAAGELGKVSDTATPFVALFCAGCLFAGAMTLMAAVLF